MSNKKVMLKVSHTVYPEHTLSEQEWMNTFRVSTYVPKYDGVERAREMMYQWQENKPESIWKMLISKLNVVK